jgi:hypothetical protein
LRFLHPSLEFFFGLLHFFLFLPLALIDCLEGLFHLVLAFLQLQIHNLIVLLSELLHDLLDVIFCSHLAFLLALIFSQRFLESLFILLCLALLGSQLVNCRLALE